MFGERVKEIREDAKLNQSDFGARIGVNKSGLSKIEKNKVSLSKLVIKNLTNEFCVNELWLLTGEGSKYNQEKLEKQQLLDDYLFTSALFNEDFKQFGVFYNTLDVTDHIEINTAFWSLVDVLKKPNMIDKSDYYETIAGILSDLKRYVDFCESVPQNKVDTAAIVKVIHKSGFAYEQALKDMAEIYFNVEFSLTGKQFRAAEGDEVKESDVPYSKQVRVLGNVAAGIPIDAIYHPDDLMALSGTSKADFALKIRGDSMEPRIMDGSTVLIEANSDIHNGQIAIVDIAGEVTCKKIVLANDHLELHSFNSKYSPRIISKEDVEKDGVRVIGYVLLDKELGS